MGYSPRWLNASQLRPGDTGAASAAADNSGVIHYPRHRRIDMAGTEADNRYSLGGFDTLPGSSRPAAAVG